TTTTSREGPDRRAGAKASALLPGDNMVGGKKRWFVPDAFLPEESSRGVVSHEAACLLNVGEADAKLRFTFFFEDRAPIGPVELRLAGRRAWHLRLDDPDSIGGVELP